MSFYPVILKYLPMWISIWFVSLLPIFMYWLIAWLIDGWDALQGLDGLNGWTDWLVGCLTDWLVDWLIDWFDGLSTTFLCQENCMHIYMHVHIHAQVRDQNGPRLTLATNAITLEGETHPSLGLRRCRSSRTSRPSLPVLEVKALGPYGSGLGFWVWGLG